MPQSEAADAGAARPRAAGGRGDARRATAWPGSRRARSPQRSGDLDAGRLRALRRQGRARPRGVLRGLPPAAAALRPARRLRRPARRPDARSSQTFRSFVRDNPVLAEVMFSRPFADFDPGPRELRGRRARSGSSSSDTCGAASTPACWRATRPTSRTCSSSLAQGLAATGDGRLARHVEGLGRSSLGPRAAGRARRARRRAASACRPSRRRRAGAEAPSAPLTAAARGHAAARGGQANSGTGVSRASASGARIRTW